MSRNFNIKVRQFPGENINDMYHYFISILNKKPDYTVLHVGIKAVDTESSVIVDKLL